MQGKEPARYPPAEGRRAAKHRRRLDVMGHGAAAQGQRQEDEGASLRHRQGAAGPAGQGLQDLARPSAYLQVRLLRGQYCSKWVPAHLY